MMDFICSVASGLKRRWPKNLSVKKLEIFGSLSVNDIEYLSSIDCDLDLYLNSVRAEHMYQLLERMGQHVKSLTIADASDCNPEVVYNKSDIILERILSACPDLEKFVYKTSRKVVQDENYNLPPSAFRNFKE
jgi:hypothetical protein